MTDPSRVPGGSRRDVPDRRPRRRPDEAAGYHLAATARRFTRRSRSIVDDKLSFTATLVRAGEVRAARRVFAEVEHELAEEKAALFEAVGEARAAAAAGAGADARAGAEAHPVSRVRAPARGRQVRRRLVRLVAVATLSAASLSVSALGVALAAMISERMASPAAPDARGDGDASPGRAVKRNREVHSVRIAPGVEVPMDSKARRLFRRLATDGTVDAGELRAFLSLLPPKVAALVTETMATGATGLEIETALMSVLWFDSPVTTEPEDGAAAASSSEAENDASGDAAGQSGSEEGADRADKAPEEDGDGDDAEDPLYLEDLFDD